MPIPPGLLFFHCYEAGCPNLAAMRGVGTHTDWSPNKHGLPFCPVHADMGYSGFVWGRMVAFAFPTEVPENLRPFIKG